MESEAQAEVPAVRLLEELVDALLELTLVELARLLVLLVVLLARLEVLDALLVLDEALEERLELVPAEVGELLVVWGDDVLLPPPPQLETESVTKTKAVKPRNRSRAAQLWRT